MKIEKSFSDPNYMFLMMDNIHIHLTDFEQESTGVRLFNGDSIVGYLYFEQATEFYKAWRAM